MNHPSCGPVYFPGKQSVFPAGRAILPADRQVAMEGWNDRPENGSFFGRNASFFLKKIYKYMLFSLLVRSLKYEKDRKCIIAACPGIAGFDIC
jgi:hypothetical protein